MTIITATRRRASFTAILKGVCLIALLAMGGCGGQPESADAPSSPVAAQAASGRAYALAGSDAAADAGAARSPVLTIRGAGSLAAGVGAHVIVRYKGRWLAEGEVASGRMQDYSIQLPGPLDGGALDVVLVNALDAAGRTVRSVRIESVTVAAIEIRPDDADVMLDAGEGEAAFDGKDLLPGRHTLAINGALRFNLPTAAEVAAAAGPTPLAPGLYIDAVRGNDRDVGTASAPWRTLGRLSGVALPAGHGVYLRCGSIWRESLDLASAQLQDGSMVAGYGPECARRKAVISGADDFSGGWQRSGNVWSRPLPSGTPKISQLFMDGAALHTAQWPNGGEAAGTPEGIGTATTRLSSNRRVGLQAGDAAGLAAKDLVGATAQLRTQPWLVESRQVSAVSGGEIVLDKATEWVLDAGEGYVLQDKAWMLDSAGEFFHDVSAQKLYLVMPGSAAVADPNDARIEGSVRDIALSLAGRSGLVVRDLGLNDARADGLRLTNGPSATLSKLESRRNGSAGLRLWQWEPLAGHVAGPTISDSLVSGNGQIGIDAGYVRAPTIERNRILSTGTGVHHQSGSLAAVSAGPGGRVIANTVDGAAYIGIRFSSQGGSLVAGNTVLAYCVRLSDCGAIYTWQGRVDAGLAQAAMVENNRVLGGQAQLAGAVSAGREMVAGIYLDDFVRHIVVRGNDLAGTPIGVFVHNASNITVESNRIWLPGLAAFYAGMDQTDADWMTGNIWRDNEIVPLVRATVSADGLPSFATSPVLWFLHATAGEAALAQGRNSFTGNRTVQLQGPLAVHAWLRGPGTERHIDALEWRAIQPGDLPPSRPAQFDTHRVLLGPELLAGGGFDRGLDPWGSYTNPAGSGFSLQAVDGHAGCTGPCISLTAGHPTDILGSPSFRMRAGAVHAYRWTAVMPPSAAGSVGLPYISRSVSPWDPMTDSRGFVGYGSRRAGAGERLSYERFFSPKAGDAAQVNLQLETLRAPVAFDSVSVREVLAFEPAQPRDWSALLLAPAGAALTVACGDLKWPVGCSAMDVDGRTLAMPTTLAPGTSRLLLRADSPFRR